jgi:hypothetical protein
MKDKYDFSKGKRGRVIPEPPLEKGKLKITIRLDEDIVDRLFPEFEHPQKPGATCAEQSLQWNIAAAG